MKWWLAELSAREVVHKLKTRIIPNVRHLRLSRVRRCRACDRLSLIVAFGADEEFHLCVRCRANLRYELLATCIRKDMAPIHCLDVLELDPGSPLRPLLSGAKSYARTYFREHVERGFRREDGAVCQDITNLTYPDNSWDLIVSSDVLEHVPDAAAAFRETARTLRPGGSHIFTVPPRPATIRRAYVEQGRVIHLETPEYHMDPLSAAGILAFWDYGPDIAAKIDTSGLNVRVVRGPVGRSGRVVWRARKILSGGGG
jgi:hypothetical protein